MNIEKLVSFVLAVYNGENYLKRVIDSILSQPRFMFELIIVDDGSTDSSSQIIGDYLKKYKGFIEYIKSENHGVNHARNLGIEASHGEYIIFIDQDDYVLPNTFDDKLVEKLNDYKNDCVDAVAFRYIKSNKFVDRFVVSDNEIQSKQIEKGEERVYMIAELPIHFVFYNRRLFFERNIRCFDEYKNVDTDMPFTHLLLYNSKKVIVDNSIIMYCWVNNPHSVSHGFDNFIEKNISLIDSWKKVYLFHINKNNQKAARYCASYLCGVYYYFLLGYYGRHLSKNILKKTVKRLNIQRIIDDYKEYGNNETINGLNFYYNHKFGFILKSRFCYIRDRIANKLMKTKLISSIVDTKRYPLKIDQINEDN